MRRGGQGMGQCRVNLESLGTKLSYLSGLSNHAICSICISGRRHTLVLDLITEFVEAE